MYATSTYVTVPLPKPSGLAKAYGQDFIFWKLPSSIIHPTIQPSIRAHKIMQDSFILSLFILPAVPIGKQRRKTRKENDRELLKEGENKTDPVSLLYKS